MKPARVSVVDETGRLLADGNADELAGGNADERKTPSNGGCASRSK